MTSKTQRVRVSRASLILTTLAEGLLTVFFGVLNALLQFGAGFLQGGYFKTVAFFGFPVLPDGGGSCNCFASPLITALDYFGHLRHNFLDGIQLKLALIPLVTCHQA